jgi:hypothetical protein
VQPGENKMGLKARHLIDQPLPVVYVRNDGLTKRVTLDLIVKIVRMLRRSE